MFLFPTKVGFVHYSLVTLNVIMCQCGLILVQLSYVMFEVGSFLNPVGKG